MRPIFLVLAILLTTLLAMGSLLKLDSGQLPIPLFQHSDKVLHFTAYFVLTTNWLFAFMKKITLKIKLIISFSVLLYGTLMEFLQGFLTTYREADYLDFIANSMGVLVAFLSYKLLVGFYKMIFER